MRTVVGLVVCVADALYGLAADGAWLQITTVDGHVLAKGRYFLREGFAGLGVEAVDPELEGAARRVEEALPFFAGEFLCELDGREAGGVEDLVGVGVADAGEDARVGEAPLEGAVFGAECGAEVFEGRGEDVDASGVDVFGGGFASEEMEGGTAFGAGFGEDEGALGEVECGEVVAAAEFGPEGTPVEATGDHKVQDEPEAIVEFNGDALANAMEGTDGVAFDVLGSRLDGAEEEWAGYADLGEGLAYDARLEGGEVGGDVGEFGH